MSVNQGLICNVYVDMHSVRDLPLLSAQSQSLHFRESGIRGPTVRSAYTCTIPGLHLEIVPRGGEMSDCEKMGGRSYVSVGISPQAVGGSGGMPPPPPPLPGHFCFLDSLRWHLVHSQALF